MITLMTEAGMLVRLYFLQASVVLRLTFDSACRGSVKAPGSYISLIAL